MPALPNVPSQSSNQEFDPVAAGMAKKASIGNDTNETFDPVASGMAKKATETPSKSNLDVLDSKLRESESKIFSDDTPDADKEKARNEWRDTYVKRMKEHDILERARQYVPSAGEMVKATGEALTGAGKTAAGALTEFVKNPIKSSIALAAQAPAALGGAVGGKVGAGIGKLAGAGAGLATSVGAGLAAQAANKIVAPAIAAQAREAARLDAARLRDWRYAAL
jgi:hypothetical protein